MSLPQAKRDISENPAAGAVTDPVNKQQKDADIDRKLRLYGAIEAFRQGRLPDNAQIDRALRYVHDNSPVDVSALSPEGQRLVENVRDIVNTSREIVASKNGDELLQSFVWDTRGADLATPLNQAKSQGQDAAQGATPLDKDKVKRDSDQAVTHLRTLLHLVLTNGEARKLLSDMALIGRDLFAHGAAKAANLTRPYEERMRQVDDAAPHNEFVTEGGRRTTDTSETPVLEARIPDPRPGNEGDFTVKQHPHGEFGKGAQIHDPQGNVRSGADAYDQAQNQAQGLADQGQKRAQAEADQLRAEQDKTDDPNAKKDIAKSGLKERFNGFKDNLMGRVPQEHKDRANEHLDGTKNWFSEEYFPEERRDQFIYRAKKVIVECQRHDDYQASIKWLLGYFEEYFGHAQNAAQAQGASVDTVKDHQQLNDALGELRTLLERFAGGKSTSEMMDRIRVLFNDSKQDEQLRAWFKDVDAYARKCLLEPGFVLQDECNTQGAQIRDTGRQFYDGRYKDHFDGVFNAIGEFFSAISNDDLNARFAQDWARLTKNLLCDDEGDLKFKPELWRDIRKVILPQIVDKIGYIPIPRVEYTDDERDIVLENLTLSGRNLFPNIVTMEAHNFMKFSPYDSITDESHHEFTLNLGHIQADMRDVAFYFNNKKGPIKIRDSGLADFVLGGKGLSCTVHLASAGKDTSSVFKVKNVNVHVDTLKWSIRDSKHDVLYKTLGPLLNGLVKKQIQKALSDAIRTGFEYIDGQLVGVRERTKEVQGREGTGKVEALKEIFQSKKKDAESVKSSKEGSGQFKIVAKRDSTLLPDQGHPSGWVNRQQERANAAVKGSEWRSEAFNVV